MIIKVRFQHVDAAIIRATAFSSRPDPPPWPDLTGTSPAHVAEWMSWLRRVWADQAFAEAIEVASPALAGQIEDLCSGRIQQPRRVRSAIESTLRYLLRATGRATPFGMFAGVAPARIGGTAALRRGNGHHASARLDAAWLTALVKRLEARSDLLPQLPAVANNLVFERGERLVLPCHLQPGQAGTADITVRNTPPVRAAMSAARAPVTISVLANMLADAFPDYAVPDIEAMLATLVQHGILITSLHPPMTVTDPLGHVIAELGALSDPPLPVIGELQAIREELIQHGRALSAEERRAFRASATKRMAATCGEPAPALAVDLRLDWTATLPSVVAAEAEAAAAALVHLAPHPHGNPSWRAWHTAFLERWGIGAVVPLAQVVDADTGIGYPAGYRTSTDGAPPSLTDRDRALLRLAQRAALDGSEVILDEDALADLAFDADQPWPHVVPHTELRFAIHAPTLDAINQGQFTLALVSAARQAGTAAGRFLHLFPSADRDRLIGVLAGLPTLHPHALLAQTSCPPLSARAGNLARSPAIAVLIPLGEHRPHTGEEIPLEDLAVSADAHRVSVLSLSRGHIVESLMVNALDFRRATHSLARFLCEITTARAAACAPFSWGAATGLPFLPRVRYRRTILHPATWIIAAADLPGPRAAWAEWELAWQQHRARHRIPTLAFLGGGDVRLRLDLDQPAHLTMLRTHLDRQATATLTEAPALEAYGWTGGHAHEIVLPMAAIPPATTTPAVRLTRPVHHHGHRPGASRWLYARLYARPDAQTEILTSHLPDLLTAWREGPEEGWWFLRHHTPEPHLRLRLPLHDPGRYGDATQQVGAWAERVRGRGLLRGIVFDTYYPEPGRYGDGPTLAAAEAVFAADSATAVAQLAISGRAAQSAAVIAASFTDLAIAFTGSIPAGLSWLVEHVPRAPALPIERVLYNQALRLADPSGHWAKLHALPGGPQTARAWRRRRDALAAYRARLTGEHSPNPDTILASLLHLHHARMSGLDPGSERLCLRLARAAALAQAHRASP
ncbi:lantibiotic dehydratase [Nonomuraea sp. 3N208]|uniref:lantibiotic dehydratase n=1 Tax=Nonomuraea sp. 3N208 TaxID=3457421 RepID=UPI003FD5B206